LLKRALGDRLPPAILRRRKKGFGVPFGAWFRGPLASLLREILANDRMRRGGLFDPDAVSRLVDEHVAGVRDHDSVLWSLVAFELWRLAYLGDGAAL
jgi:asparagine synthase (glutamine-hydrolysing)